MAPPATFRPVRPADAAECARLHAQAFAPPWSPDDLREQIGRADRVVTGIVLRSPALAGFAISRVVNEEADLLTIVVDRAARERGVGRELLVRHLESLAEQGVAAVFLEVGTDNAAARALYACAGFAPVGTRKGYYAGSTDALVLRKMLAPLS